MPTIIDCHAHYDPQLLDLATMLARMDEAGVQRVALIPALNEPIHATPELLLSTMRTLMNSPLRPLANLVHRSTLTRDGDVRILGKVHKVFKQPDNGSVAELVSQRPDRLMGWIFLNPSHDPQPLETLERWRASPGMIGVKLHPHWHDYKTEILGPVLQRCEELGLPVLIHLGFGARGDFVSLCQAYPKLKLISAHAGFPFYKALWRTKSDCPNLFVDLSSPYINEALARQAVTHMGAERCLYGTDAPYGFPAEDGGYDYGEIRRWVERMPVSSGQVELMMGGSFLEMLG